MLRESRKPLGSTSPSTITTKIGLVETLATVLQISIQIPTAQQRWSAVANSAATSPELITADTPTTSRQIWAGVTVLSLVKRSVSISNQLEMAVKTPACPHVFN
ncbi:hypothetical protein CCB80_10905 [Armatimonadetes bacterium Uphvl-Ar1]|nr:hypothetical protein CCB80_10905 [Armatimonadetes bacterium Uphvl-Ar1]